MASSNYRPLETVYVYFRSDFVLLLCVLKLLPLLAVLELGEWSWMTDVEGLTEISTATNTAQLGHIYKHIFFPQSIVENC